MEAEQFDPAAFPWLRQRASETPFLQTQPPRPSGRSTRAPVLASKATNQGKAGQEFLEAVEFLGTFRGGSMFAHQHWR
jgi:hypothetical protein